MSMNFNKAAALFDQLFGSVFNFSIVIVLSNTQESSLASYGLVYSFALMYVAFLKNGALNIYLTDGCKDFYFLMSLIFKVLASYYSLFFVLCVSIYAFVFLEDVFSYLIVFLFYVFLEVNRVYLFSIKREVFNLVVNLVCYSFVLISLYFSSVGVSFSFALFGQFLLLFSFFEAGCSHRLEKYLIESKSVKLGGSSFILTLSYSMYAHGPLWVLYVVDDGMAKMFVQIRNLFQPVQMVSRVVDLYEKRSSGSGEYSYEVFKKRVLVSAFFVVPVAIVVSLLSGFLFGYIYSTDVGGLEIGLIWVYSLICILTFLSKPVETWFYKIKDLDPIVKSRVIASILFLLAVPFFVFFESEFTLLILLVYLSFVWGVVVFRNLMVIKLSKNARFY